MADNSFQMDIDELTDTLIRGRWFDEVQNKWRTFAYTRMPDRANKWQGAFALISAEDLKDAVAKELYQLETPPHGTMTTDPTVDTLAGYLKVDTSLQFYEHNVHIELKAVDGQVFIHGFGTNRYGSFTINGTTTYLIKRYHDIHDTSTRKRRQSVYTTSFTALRKAHRVAYALRSSLKDERYDLEQDVLSGKLNKYEVVQEIKDPVKRKLFESKYNEQAYTAMERSMKRMDVRVSQRHVLQRDIQQLRNTIDTMKDRYGIMRTKSPIGPPPPSSSSAVVIHPQAVTPYHKAVSRSPQPVQPT